MVEGLHRSKPEISTAVERIQLLQTNLVNCLLSLNRQNNTQAVSNYSDAEKQLKELNEVMSDLGRKVRGEI